MTTLITMYSAKTNSPVTTIASPGIDADDTTIPVTDCAVFDAGPNRATIGTGIDCETILYTGRSAGSGAGNLTGVTRGVEGTAASWLAGTIIARRYTAADHDAFKSNIETLAALDAFTFKGGLDCSSNPNFPAADAGDTYKITGAGKVGGASGVSVEIGDTIYCTKDGTTSGTYAAKGAYWVILQTNIVGAISTEDTPEQGDIPYRGSSAYNLLHHGNAGQVVISGGHGANPSFNDVDGGTASAESVPIRMRRDTAANLASSNPTVAAGCPVWDMTNKRMRIGDGSTAHESLPDVLRMPLTVVTVGASRCDYTTVNAALAAITDNAEGKEYLIVLYGNVTDTANVSWKSYVHLQGQGANWTINHTASSAGLSISSVTRARLSDVRIVRTGAVSSGQAAVYVSGTTDSSVILSNIVAENQLSGYSGCYGLYVLTTSSPVIVNSSFTGAGTTNGVGIYIGGSASPVLRGCIGTGGNGGNTCSGIMSESTGSPYLFGCTGTGGTGGTNCNGFYIASVCSLKMYYCTGIGGSNAGGTNHGIFGSGVFGATIIGCKFIGGPLGSGCHGASFPYGGIINVEGCEFQPGIGSTGNYGLNVAGSFGGRFVGCTIAPFITGSSFSFTGSGWSFVPAASVPTYVETIYIDISVAGSTGEMINVGTTDGGTEIGSVSAASTGNKWLTINRVALAAGATVYAKPSAGNSSAARYIVYYTVGYNYGTNYAAYIDTTGPLRITGCDLRSNQASSGVYITTTALTAAKYLIQNSALESVGTYGLEGQSALVAMVRQCSIGGTGVSTCLVPDTGLVEYGGGAA